MQNVTHSLLIVEPNEKLTHPYNLLPSTYHITRVSTITEALDFVEHTLPKTLLLSASFTLAEQLKLLEALRLEVHSTIPRVVFVVDFSCLASSIPGTTWGGLAQVISTQTTKKALEANLSD